MTEAFVLPPDQGESLVIASASMSIKTADTGSNHLFVAEHFMPPMFPGPPPHLHEEMDHSFYILEGSVRFIFAGEESIASKGSFIYIPPSVAHSFGNPSDLPTRFLEINVPAGFERYYRELALAFPPGSALEPARIYEIQQRYGTRPA